MATVRIYNFNNYYNRKYKVNDALEDYGTPIYTETGTNVNFNPSDGVNTQYTAGRQNNPYSGEGDYLIYSEGNTDITSRWFIIEQDRNRLGQYSVQLRRDVLADNPSWMEAPTFIEKCTLTDVSPFIFNNENFSVNQIKSGQTPIYDKTGCPWIVGFMPNNLSVSEPITVPDSSVIADFSISMPMRTWLDTADQRKWFSKVDDYRIYYNTSALGGDYYYINLDNKIVQITDPNEKKISAILPSGGDIYLENTYYSESELFTILKSYLADQYLFGTGPDYTGKTIKDSDGRIWRVNSQVKNYTAAIKRFEKATDPYTYFYNRMRRVHGLQSPTEPNGDAFGVSFSYYTYTLEVTDITYTSGQYSIPFNSFHQSLTDAPYTMFCLPYGEVTETYSGKTVITNAETNLRIANTLNSYSDTESADKAFATYDIQIVPYCPLPDSYLGDKSVTYEAAERVLPISYTKAGDTTTVGFIYFPSTSSKKSVITTQEITLQGTGYDIKTASQCMSYRLVAPNYTSAFEFVPAKNRQFYISGDWVVSMTYKPFSSYIKICPEFSGLYGENYQDNRGLVFNGISLPKTTNAFNQMKLSQRYYQDTFDRQIQSMEFNNRQQLIQQGISAGVNALGAGATAGMLTGKVGVGIGAGIISGLAGVADIGITKALQNEALDYTKDNFGYQLGNVKAQPNTLSRTADYNADTIFVPVVETYNCYYQEAQAFINKCRYNGMTAMFIDLPVNVINNSYNFTYWAGVNYVLPDLGYFKGVPIRLDDVSDDYHMAKTIAEELNKGVYMK